MPAVMMHYFADEDFYKISYTGKTVEAFEAMESERRWADRKWGLVWSKNFDTPEEARAFKSAKLKNVPKFTPSFLSGSDTFKTDNPPGLEDGSLYVYVFQVGDFYKCGHTDIGHSDLVFPGETLLWEAKVPTLELAKSFVKFIASGGVNQEIKNKFWKTAFSTSKNMDKKYLISEFKKTLEVSIT